MVAVEDNDQNQTKLIQEFDMEKERFVETGKSSFFGDYLYEQIVPEDHFFTETQTTDSLGTFYPALDQALQRRRNIWSSAL